MNEDHRGFERELDRALLIEIALIRIFACLALLALTVVILFAVTGCSAPPADGVDALPAQPFAYACHATDGRDYYTTATIGVYAGPPSTVLVANGPCDPGYVCAVQIDERAGGAGDGTSRWAQGHCR